MTMGAWISILFVVPLSFLFYGLSERMIAKHESRVGREILLSNFLVQAGIDTWKEIRSHRSLSYWFVFLLQCSLVFLFDIDVEYLVFIYLALNVFAVTYFHQQRLGTVMGKIESDRQEVRSAVAIAIALLCLFGCFTLNKTTSLAQLHFSGIEMLFVIPFQLAGMILFKEPPFNGESPSPGWVESVKFYLWSMLCVKLFLGGGSFFIDFHIKSAVIYMAFRVAGIYFPKFQQRDLLRVSILYIIPITGLLWLSVVLIYGLFVGVGFNV